MSKTALICGIGAVLWAGSLIFAQGAKKVSYSFPKDHAAHPDFQVEWWYYTGHLKEVFKAAHADRLPETYGFELTFFSVRFPQKKTAYRYSDWIAPRFYFAHFALSDKNKKVFYFAEKSNRSIAGIAGEKTRSFHVWNEDWFAKMEKGRFYLKAQLESQGKSISLALELDPLKPPVIHGLEGVSLKGPQQGNYSHYYSITRIKAQAVLTINNKNVPLQGIAWMDHEWMNNFSFNNLLKWDWFSLQLDNNQEIMFYILRDQHEKPLSISSGSLVDSKGNRHHLDQQQVSIQVLNYWKSPLTQIRYPIEWVLNMKHKANKQSKLSIRPYFNNQELDTRKSSQIVYWEGAVQVEGVFKGQSVQGKGYVEMTGYSKKSQ